VPEKSLSYLSSSDLRSKVADFLVKNKEHYAPFLEIDVNCGQNGAHDFDSYVEKLRNSEIWGGHVEIIIISKILNLNISVLQWNGQKGTEIQRFVDEESSQEPGGKCTVLYYQHMSQSSHYNGSLPKL